MVKNQKIGEKEPDSTLRVREEAADYSFEEQ